MKWTYVGSHGTVVVLKLLLNERLTHALQKLQISSFGSKQSSTSHFDFQNSGALRRPQSRIAFFCPSCATAVGTTQAYSPVHWSWQGSQIGFRHTGGSAK
jgi:hypothetical protein